MQPLPNHVTRRKPDLVSYWSFQLKLLRFIRSLNPEAGGPMEGVRQITQYLSSMGVDTTVVSLDSSDETFLQDQPFEVVGLGVFSHQVIQ